MSARLEVVIVDDSADDAELVLRELRRAGFEPVHERVDSREPLREALLRKKWDVILSDFTMPCFTALEALMIAKAIAPEVPFIVVSGTISEEMAVQAMRAGARDYVVKENLVRLAPAVEREVRESAVRAAHRESESERRRAKAALRESEELVRLLLDSTAEAIYGMDLRGCCTFANAACLKMLGYRDPHDVVGKNMHELTHHTRADGTPYPQEECRLLRASFQEEGAVIDDEVFWRSDRTSFPAEYRSFPVRRNGIRVGAVVSFTDITPRQKAEEAVRRGVNELRNSERRFRALVENSKDAIVMAAADGTILYISPAGARIVGYAPDDLVGRKALEGIHPDDHDVFRGMFHAVLEEPRRAVSAEYRRFHRDGSVRHIEATATNLLDDPAIGAVVGNFRDVTERKRAEEALRETEKQLRQAQKMEAIGRLAGGVAHDFNNVLSVILSYAEMMRVELRAGDPLRSDVEEIHAAGKRASSLTRQLLAFSRQQVLQPAVIDLNEIVAGMEKMLRTLIGEDIELTVTSSQRPAHAHVDPGQMEQVVMNLAVNARDAMPQGGRLAIDVAKTPSQVTLTVKDTGMGMDEATRARIFEPFFTTKEVGKGTGLGLSTVFGIVQQSGGTITVESQPGTGATFRIQFPAVAPPGPGGPPASGEASRARGGSETILLLDDDDHVRKVAHAILAREGYQVLEARTAADALALCQQHPGHIDLLLTDVVMPQMGGGEVAVRVREDRPSTRVLYMSGYPDDALVQRGLAHSAVSFLEKPLTPEKLIGKVREVLDRPSTK